MNIVVLGSAGQVGKALNDVFTKKNLSLIEYTHKSCDLNDYKSVRNILYKNEPDFIINCSAYTKVDDAEHNKEAANATNTLAVKNLAKISSKLGSTLIHISTDYVFDGNTTVPYDEESIECPVNHYGFTKLMGEKAAKKNCKKLFIIRTSAIYSKHGKNFINTVLRLAEENKELQIIHDQITKPTYAQDLASCIYEIVNSNSLKYGTYNYAGGEEISWYDFAKKILYYKKKNTKIKKISINEYKSAAKRPQYSSLDSSKIIKILNLKTTTLDNALKEIF